MRPSLRGISAFFFVNFNLLQLFQVHVMHNTIHLAHFIYSRIEATVMRSSTFFFRIFLWWNSSRNGPYLYNKVQHLYNQFHLSSFPILITFRALFIHIIKENLDPIFRQGPVVVVLVFSGSKMQLPTAKKQTKKPPMPAPASITEHVLIRLLFTWFNSA